MRMLILLLALSACSPEPRVIIDRVFITTVPPPAKVYVAPKTIAGVRKVRELESREQKLLKDAGNYVIWKQAKPDIIKTFSGLLATEKAAMTQLHEAKTLSDRAAAIPAVEAAQDAIMTYLAVKGD